MLSLREILHSRNAASHAFDSSLNRISATYLVGLHGTSTKILLTPVVRGINICSVIKTRNCVFLPVHGEHLGKRAPIYGLDVGCGTEEFF